MGPASNEEGDTRIWVSYKGAWILDESEKVHGLVLDTGAAANVTGDSVLMSYEKDVLAPRGEAVEYIESHQEFTGIAEQTPQARREAWMSTYPGGIGMSWYRAHVFEESNFPSLLCTPSVRTAGMLISCRHDRGVSAGTGDAG